MGACCLDAKEETQVKGPHNDENTDGGHRSGPTRISIEVSVLEIERRGWIIQPYCLVESLSKYDGLLFYYPEIPHISLRHSVDRLEKAGQKVPLTFSNSLYDRLFLFNC